MHELQNLNSIGNWHLDCLSLLDSKMVRTDLLISLLMPFVLLHVVTPSLVSQSKDWLLSLAQKETRIVLSFSGGKLFSLDSADA